MPPPAIHLETWRALFGLHPWHFWQWAGEAMPMNGACGVTVEEGWQAGDAAGRADIRRALASAEARLAALLGVTLAPDAVSATLPMPTPRYGQPARLFLPVSPILALGAPIYTQIGTASVVYSDRDGDDLNDIWTSQLTTTETNPLHLFCVVSANDRREAWLDLATDTLPATVSIVGGVATFRGRAWTMARPLKYAAANGAPLDPSDTTNFLSSIAIYQRTFSATPFLAGASCGCSACGGAITGTVQSAATGLVCLSSCACWGDQVAITYTAGLDWSLSSGWQTALARLTAAELGAPVCACEDVNRELYRWQKDMALTGKSDEQYGAISAGDLSNPLGTRRGAIAAYRYLLTAQSLGGVRA